MENLFLFLSRVEIFPRVSPTGFDSTGGVEGSEQKQKAKNINRLRRFVPNYEQTSTWYGNLGSFN